MKSLALALTVVSLFFTNFKGAHAANACNTQVKAEQELFISNSEIILSPEASGFGAFSFSSLMKKLSPTKKIDTLIKAWLSEWSLNQTANGLPSLPRNTGGLTWLWPKDKNGELTENAPFVLDAILYRPDLNNGELRFVFNLVDPDLNEAQQFSVIFEFPLQGEHWLTDIHALSALPTWEARLQQLVSLTAQLDPKTARVRTNDFFFAFEWDLRDFRVNDQGFLKLTALDGTPHGSFNDGEKAKQLQNWIEQNQQSILAGNKINLPEQFKTASSIAPDEGFHWLKNQGLNENLRQAFAAQTCNGCHSGETTTRFTHIEPRTPFQQPLISEFLKKDLKVRAEIMEQRLCAPGSKQLANLLDSRRGRVH